jgi:hypothetical protein
MAGCQWHGKLYAASDNADEEGWNHLASHLIAIAVTAPKTSPPANTKEEKLWAVSQCIAQ